MSKKVCKRKIYPLVNPIGFAIAGAAITPSDILDKLRMRELTSIESLTSGNGSVHDWAHMTEMMNLAEQFARQGVGPEVLPHCAEAQNGLKAAAKHFEKTRVMHLSRTTLKALREVYEYHDLQRSSVSRAEYEQVMRNAKNYIRSKGQFVIEV